MMVDVHGYILRKHWILVIKVLAIIYGIRICVFLFRLAESIRKGRTIPTRQGKKNE